MTRDINRYMIIVLVTWLFFNQIEINIAANQTDAKSLEYRRDNITILHEVNSEDQSTISLNTHEVLPLKPFKKKPYIPLEKILPRIEYIKPHPLKEYELHPVTFDFNLGDLEDLEHEVIKKGDLSSAEQEQHVLANGDGDADVENDDSELSYRPHNPDGNDTVDVEIAELTSGGSTEPTTATSPATTTPMADSNTTSPTSPMTTIGTTTSSTHILKILRSKPASTAKRGRELLKQSDDDTQLKTLGSTINSISRYLGGNATTNASSSMADSLYGSANYFQIVTNLYDHFYWQVSEIRTNVRTGCGLEMQAYLTALHSSYEWAQKAYDASGRYRGQLLFGNDKWLGQLGFCYEVNRQVSNEERKRFDLEFYVADIALHLPRLNRSLLLSLGECLPKSCSAHDVQSILSLDPYARMLTVLGAHNATVQQPPLQVLHVRTVPGVYSHWRQLKFQMFISFLLTLLMVVIVATYYQMRIDERRLVIGTIPAISAKCDAASNGSNGYYGKPFELFQMRPLGSNGIVNGTDHAPDVDVNGNRQRQVGDNGIMPMGLPTPATSMATPASGSGIEKTEMADYQVETGSCTGVAGTYEAEQPVALHQQLLLCFALQTNAKAILNIDRTKESHTSCLHGLRVFSVLWTMMVHTYLQLFAIGENKFERVITERSVWYQIIGNATFSVDSFFFISGLLVTLLYLKQDRKYPTETCPFIRRSCLDTLMMLFYRYLRLTPVYLFVVFFNDLAVRQGLDSSVFQPAKIEPNNCRIYWWRNILYINNFYPQREMCMMWSWYMANDMQFYVMAALLLAFARKYFKATVLTLIVFLLSSWSIAGILSIQHEYTHKVALPFESFDFLYDKPWQRVGSYIVGMFAGYVLYKVKTPPQISRRSNLLLWSGSLGLLLVVVFGVWEGQLSTVNTAFYVGVGHTAFGCGLIWIVLSCCWGLAPTVNAILSYRVLWPLSRLTYCAYLIHPIIMFICSSHMSGTVHLNNPMILTMFLGNAVVSFGSAFVISALFEAPVIRILKICFKK
ncbi:O-acyltransferase like protein [Drosophila tropicalis]|uniref:O-acyltransferase like protein n=1 Tax=Drosophila tropicalis TaxID=46794 RepID=UPI0035AB91E1